MWSRPIKRETDLNRLAPELTEGTLKTSGLWIGQTFDQKKPEVQDFGLNSYESRYPIRQLSSVFLDVRCALLKRAERAFY